MVDGGPANAAREALVARVMELAPLVRRRFEVRPGSQGRATWRSLTVHQLEALVALDEASLTMGELCERLAISESAGTALCDRLATRNMVARAVDPSDRRLVRLSPTGAARSMAERYRELKRRRIAEVLAVLDGDELAALARIYEAVLGRDPDGQRACPPGSGEVRP